MKVWHYKNKYPAEESGPVKLILNKVKLLKSKGDKSRKMRAQLTKEALSSVPIDSRQNILSERTQSNLPESGQNEAIEAVKNALDNKRGLRAPENFKDLKERFKKIHPESKHPKTPGLT